jgi:Raf kinase inhibitor-like YbhB/YbcL family protein
VSETVNDGAYLAEAQRSGAFGVPGGEDVSPQLSWSGAPAGTKSYVVTCYDPDAPTVSGFWHWAMYDIPSDVLSLALDAGAKGGGNMPPGAKMLKNDAGFPGFLGAAPPEGHGDHRYMFVVSALGVDTLPIDAATSPSVMSFNMFGAGVLARARITAIYGR